MDDLVKRANFALSDMQGRIDAGKLQVFRDCIDRIEELEANINLKADFIDATINQLADSDQRIEELEAKLAKAVEALGNISNIGVAWSHKHEDQVKEAQEVARATLAAIKEKPHD